VKGFRVEASDGSPGEVSWASYAAGESYLVVTRRHTCTRRITSCCGRARQDQH